jgi:hypothetical protein
MDWGNFFKELGVRSSLLWGVAIGSAILLAIDKTVMPLGLPANWQWVLPVAAALSGAMILIGVISTGAPLAMRQWEQWKARKRRDKYAIENLAIASNFDKAVLLHYKGRNTQRFRGRREVDHLWEMVNHGFLVNDSLVPHANIRHYRIADVVWKFLDNPPAGWGQGVVVRVDWE